MQSPKFQFLRADLESVFSKKALKDEWKKRVRAQIRKQVIFDAIEYRDYNENISSIVSRTCSKVIEGKYNVHTPKRYLAEKSRGLCRQMTLIHPIDLLVLERLSRSMYFELKSKNPSSAAFFEPDDGSFVKGFKQADFQYGSFASWKKFQKEVFGFTKENKYIVITDVANFYDFINFQHLRNIIASLADIREGVLDLLIYILNRLTWTPDFMPLTQIGMPQIETSATRVLANAMLYEVDKVCEHAAIANYARFMDDMDIGVNSISSSKEIIRDIDLTLQSRQLRLNSAKTKILSQKDAFSHFCIKENRDLARIDVLITKNILPTFMRRIIQARYENWLSRTTSGGRGESSRFNSGNGPKIHKYTLKLIYDANSYAPESDLLWLIKNDPGMRSTALRYLSKSNKSNTNFNEIYKMARSGVFVDDASLVDITGYLIHSKFKRTNKFLSIIEKFCNQISIKSDIGLHCSIFILSKFLPSQKLLQLLSSNIERISGDFWLSRAAAGVSPLFIGDSDMWGKYHETILKIDSEDANDVINYLLDIAKSSIFNQSLKAYLDAQNDSFSQGIYFPKVLILLAASKNPNITRLMPHMHTQHPALKKDTFFNSMGF